MTNDHHDLPDGLDPDGDGMWSAGVDEPAGRWARQPRRRKVAAVLAGMVLVSGALAEADDASSGPAAIDGFVEASLEPGAAPTSPSKVAPAQAAAVLPNPKSPREAAIPEVVEPEPTPTPSPTVEVAPEPSAEVRRARVIDGDTLEVDGVRVRLGLVNTAEPGERCADEATAFTAAFVRDGVVVEAYATDAYDRSVAEVLDGDGASLNVALAASGWADDRYLDEFRHENPDLARRVEAAFASAPDRGCTTPAPAPAPAPEPEPEPEPARDNCHWSYVECLPIKGDGSGRGDANDLDCGDIRHLVHLKKIGDDPYGLDGNDNDGLGCESYG